MTTISEGGGHWADNAPTWQIKLFVLSAAALAAGIGLYAAFETSFGDTLLMPSETTTDGHTFDNHM